LIGEKWIVGSSIGTSSCNNDQGWTNGWDNDMLTFSQGDRDWGVPSWVVPTFAQSQPPIPDVSVIPKHWDMHTTALGNDACGGVFGAIHSEAMNVVLCDGSVRGLTYDISQSTFYRLCRINDGTTFELD
jgi:prepilin-type processing-associated H-X9-DG protein